MLKKNEQSFLHFSEFELIDYFIKNSSLKKSSNVIVPSGDDAFVGKIGQTFVVITTDILTENSDFKLNWYQNPLISKKFKLNFKQLGIKLARINLSDIFSMGKIQPLWAIGNLSLNNKISKKNVQDIFLGIRNELRKFNCEIVGGDISKSKEISLSLTIIGITKSKKILLRNSFKVGDYICVTGTLGDSIAGLKILQNQKKFLCNKKIKSYLVKRHLYPEIRYETIKFLLPYLTSLTDISDGLYKNLEIMSQSRKDVVIEINSDKIPVSEELKSFCNNKPLKYKNLAISGGEDYEFLFTINQKFTHKLNKLKNVHIIGQVKKRKNSKEKIVITNLEQNISFKSFDHFIK
ncbi:MAG: thiamine-phosphate kinase [Endomicrobiia bacterium]